MLTSTYSPAISSNAFSRVADMARYVRERQKSEVNAANMATTNWNQTVAWRSDNVDFPIDQLPRAYLESLVDWLIVHRHTVYRTHILDSLNERAEMGDLDAIHDRAARLTFGPKSYFSTPTNAIEQMEASLWLREQLLFRAIAIRLLSVAAVASASFNWLAVYVLGNYAGNGDGHDADLLSAVHNRSDTDRVAIHEALRRVPLHYLEPAGDWERMLKRTMRRPSAHEVDGAIRRLCAFAHNGQWTRERRTASPMSFRSDERTLEALAVIDRIVSSSPAYGGVPVSELAESLGVDIEEDEPKPADSTKPRERGFRRLDL